MLPPSSAPELLPNCFRNAHLIATDMDGTLTLQGRFSAMMLAMLETLAMAGWPVLIVTGRSAGWVNGIAHYLPVAGAIAENGGVFYDGKGDRHLITPIADIADHRDRLAVMFQQLQRRYPMLIESIDNPFRLTDWTFDIQGLAQTEIEAIAHMCQDQGWDFTYSTVQCHITPPGQNKAKAVLAAIAQQFPQYTADQVVTVGDSPNDVSLFDPAHFPCSVGVANLEPYRDRLQYFPRHLTAAAEAEGFCELAQALLQKA
ncbi:MAG: HAD family phosphatase [Cyanothece sp. SIO2G6]|nr:HAD family phosphatase [Cyanothece sp. SIO2G6]